MALIGGIISTEGFELVRDRIGEILANELQNQYALTGSDYLNVSGVYVERTIPVDKEECPVVIVSLARGDFSGQDQTGTDGTYSFNIDAFVSDIHEDDKKGDTNSIKALHRLLAVCRAILENQLYKTLGFSMPFIMNRRCVSIEIADPDPNDAWNNRMGRLVVSVKLIEKTNIKELTNLATFETRVKLGLTEKGYKWQ